MQKTLHLLVCLLFLTTFNYINAQQLSKVDSMLIDVDKTSFTSHFLYDRTIALSNLTSFNEENAVATKGLFEQALQELYKASNQQQFIDYKTARTFYTHDSIKNTVDIGIINTTFHSLNYTEEDETHGALKIKNDKFEELNNSNEPFLKHHALMAAPLKKYVRGAQIIFNIKNSLFFQDTENKDIISLTANFDTSTNYTLINNGVITTPTINISYDENGYKTLTFTATFADGSTQSTQALIYATVIINQPAGPEVEDGNIIADVAWQGLQENTPYFGKIDYRIFYSPTNTQNTLIKPIIIIDGFDPGDKRKFQDADFDGPPQDHLSIFEFMFYVNSNGNRVELIDELQSLGYDVVLVNQPTHALPENNNIEIDGGSDYIERNALAHVALYQELNNRLAQNNSNEELVIVGPSMGGQMSRYALAYMEKEGIDHNCRLWVSIDSPHLGANIPLGLQALVNQAAEADVTAAEDFVNKDLGSVAAQQQLIEQYNGKSGNQLNSSHLNGKTTGQGFSSNRGNPLFINYYNNLFNNGLIKSNGYPQNLRKIAIVNGSLKRTKEYFNPFTSTNDSFASNNSLAINIRGFQTIFWFDVHIASLEGYMMPSFNNNSKISRFKDRFSDNSRYVTNINSRGNMDNIPGGWFNGFQELAAPLDSVDPVEPGGSFWSSPFGNIFSSFSDFLGGANLTVYDNEYVNSFIPTVSALGFNDPDFNWSQNLNRNLVCSNEIPFDSYYGPKINEQHTSFTEESWNWFREELEGNPQAPTVYLDDNHLIGDDIVCENDIVTYYFESCRAPFVLEWQISDNLEIITEDNTSITVKAIGNPREPGYVRAIFPFDNILDKTLWIGSPNVPAIQGPVVVEPSHVANYDVLNPSGYASYSWNYPNGWDYNPYIDGPNSWGKPLYLGTDGTITMSVMTACGMEQSDLTVIVANGGDGNPKNTLIPFPNSSDTEFKIDFSAYPPGSYYIYIYDQYSNLKYQGDTSNIEKTVSTINIPDGVYFLHIHVGTEVIIKQLVVDH